MSRCHRSLWLAGLLGLCASAPLAAATYTWDAWVRIVNPATNSSTMVFISALTHSGCTAQLNVYLYPPQNQPNPPLVHSYKGCTLTRHDLDTRPK